MNLVAPAGPVYQAGTLSANPVGMIAGLATLKKMERLDVWAELEKKGAFLESLFNAGVRKRNLAFQMVRVGSLFWILPKTEKPVRHLGDLPANLGAVYKPFFHKMLAQNVYLAPSGYEVNFLSMAHTEQMLEATANAIVIALEEAIQG